MDQTLRVRAGAARRQGGVGGALPHGVLRRDDLTVRAGRTVWAARRA
ncbi:hypothetical protein [Streptomyces carminius]|nr:hypothetical protein [Streptomyces carminius]